MSGFTFSAKPPQGEYKLPPAGNHAAYCYGVTYLGSFEDEYQGQKKIVRKIRLDFEMPLETFEQDGKTQPFSANIQMNVSMFEAANFRKFLESWRGGRYTDEQAMQGVDVSKFVGYPAMINVVHEPNKAGSVYANIKSIAPLPKGMTLPAMVNEKRLYSVDQHDDAAFNALSPYLQEKVRSSKEWAKIEMTIATAKPAPSAPSAVSATAQIEADHAAQTGAEEPPF